MNKKQLIKQKDFPDEYIAAIREIKEYPKNYLMRVHNLSEKQYEKFVIDCNAQSN